MESWLMRRISRKRVKSRVGEEDWCTNGEKGTDEQFGGDPWTSHVWTEKAQQKSGTRITARPLSTDSVVVMLRALVTVTGR